MNNFRFYAPTDIRFGKGQADCLPEELGKYGKRILMVYGGGSVKRSGLYDRLRELLKEFEIFELPGIEPNPKITSGACMLFGLLFFDSFGFCKAN